MLQIIISSLARLNLSSNLLVRTRHFPQKLPCDQCIRCYRPRKPFWLPIAKSKMFRFRIEPVIPNDEKVELERLVRVYRTHMKSLRQYFKEQLMAQTTGPEVLEERKRKEEEHHANCIKINDLWNAEVAKTREIRLAKEEAMREEKILQKMIDQDRSKKQLLDQLDAHIRKEQEAAKTFITKDNIDEAIEVALNNVVDYNFAIDLEGNVYEGRYGKPTRPPPKKPRGLPPPPLLLEHSKSESAEAKN